MPRPPSPPRRPIGLVRTLSKLGSARVAAAVLTLVGLAATRLPLLDVPGYELAEALALAIGILGGAVGLSFARTAPARQRPAAAAGWAFAWLSAWALVAVAIVALFALVDSRCSPFAGLPFVLLLPIPSAGLSTALGLLLGRAIARPWLAGLAYAAVAVASLALTLSPLYFGPQVFAFNQLLGWFPGPLYDERVSPPDALWIYRGLTAIATLAIVALLAALASRRPGRPLALALLAFALFCGGVALEHRIGCVSSVADLDRALGGLRRAGPLVLHYPRELAPAQVEQLARLAALDLAEVDATLGLDGPRRPIDVFLFRGADEKGRLTGAWATHFTKPWLRQIHTHANAEGALVLRHELVHALTARWGRAPFAVCARLLGLEVQSGIVEGLAVAVDWPVHELTIHEWSRAMRLAGLAPDIRSIVGPTGFAAQSQGRAYTLAGSFLRFLLDSRGGARMARLYRDGDFEAAYGESLDSLAREWERFLDTVPLEGAAREAALDRFRRPSIFGRPCARELALLRADADAAAGAGNQELAANLLGRCAQIDPGDPALQEALWRAQREAGDRALAAATLARLLASPSLDPVMRSRVVLAEGDDAWAQGDLAAARAHFAEAAAKPPDRMTVRALEVRRAALEKAAGPARANDEAGAIRNYFARGGDDLSLVELASLRVPFAPASYLLGLRLTQRDRRREGLAELRLALAAALPADLAARALRSAVAAEIDLGLYRDADADLGRFDALKRSPPEVELDLELRRRLAFERKLGPIPGLE